MLKNNRKSFSLETKNLVKIFIIKRGLEISSFKIYRRFSLSAIYNNLITKMNRFQSQPSENRLFYLLLFNVNIFK